MNASSVRAFALWVLLLAPSAAADVVRDGSIGSGGPGSVSTVGGPSGGMDFLIGEADGQLSGGVNLFHSFSEFDLQADQRAIYQGPASIENLITRVTGGASSIDGVIRSEIPGAHLYFLNPAGVVFGENAQVDITGSFFVSSADRVLFGNGDVFETAIGPTPNLSVDEVNGFGFLDAPAPIRILGSQISIEPDQSLALVGGALDVRGDRSDGQAGFISAPSGRIDLASLASSGEVYLDGGSDGVLRVENVTARGDITIAGDTTVSTSGLGLDPFTREPFAFSPPKGANPADGSGPINVYGQDMLVEDADLRTLTVTNADAGDVAIDLSGTLVLRTVPGGRQSGIIAATGLVIEPGPNDVIASPPIPAIEIFTIPGVTESIFTNCTTGICGVRYNASGDAGDVLIRAARVEMENGGRITATSESFGDAGTIRLEVSESIRLSGADDFGDRSGLFSNADNTGNPGALEIISPNATLVMEDQAVIVIQNSTVSLASGSPGRIEIDVAQLEMSGNARIDSSTRGAGAGGLIDIKASESIQLQGRTGPIDFTGITTLSQPGSSGDAGDIRIETKTLDLLDGAEISAQPVGSNALGAAGNLILDASDEIRLRQSAISAEGSTSAGGNIDVFFGRLLDAQDSEITASVPTGPESGGNIAIRSDLGSALVLENSRIVANADLGPGGNILAETSLLIQDPTSAITASSNVDGLDGIVITRAPDGQSIDLSQDLNAPPIDASTLLDEPCAAQRQGGANSLIVSEREGTPLNVDAVLPALLPDSTYLLMATPLEAQPRAGHDSLVHASVSSSSPSLRDRSRRCAD